MLPEGEVLFDMNALPRAFVVKDDDAIPGSIPPRYVIDYVSAPEPGAKYLVLTHDGRITVTELEDCRTTDMRCWQRRGFMAGTDGPYRVSYHVQVLGLVLDRSGFAPGAKGEAAP